MAVAEMKQGFVSVGIQTTGGITLGEGVFCPHFCLIGALGTVWVVHQGHPPIPIGRNSRIIVGSS